MKLNKDILINLGDQRVKVHVTKLEFLDEGISGEAEYDTLAGLMINEDRENVALVFDGLEHDYEDAQNRQVTVSYDKTTGKRIETLKDGDGNDVVLHDSAANRPVGLQDELGTDNPSGSLQGKAEGSTKDDRPSNAQPSEQIPVPEINPDPPVNPKADAPQPVNKAAKSGVGTDNRNNARELRDQDVQEQTFRNDPASTKNDPKNPKGAPQSLGEAAKKV